MDRSHRMSSTVSALALAAALSWLGLSPAQAQVNALPSARHVLVYGEASAFAVPDRFVLSLAFEAVDMDAGAARARVQQMLDDTVEQLARAGVDPSWIQATTLSVEPRERYDEATRRSVFIGTAVERTLRARFNDNASLQRFIAQLKTSEQLQVRGIQSELDSEPALRAALRAEAIADSKAKAEATAKAYGARLGPVYSVSEVAPTFEYGIREGRWPERLMWDADDRSLQRIEVTGTRLSDAAGERFLAGTTRYSDKIYAVFLLD